MAKNVYIDDPYAYSGEDIKYVVKKNGITVEKGRAMNYDFPIVFYLNRTAQEYLKTDIDGLSNGVHSSPDASAVFSIVSEGGSTIYSETYVNGKAEQKLSNPVNGHADPRMKILISTFNTSSTTITI